MITLGDATARYGEAYKHMQTENRLRLRNWRNWHSDTITYILQPETDREVLCKSYALAWLTPALDVESSMSEYRRLVAGETSPSRQTNYFYGQAYLCYRGEQLAFPWEHKQRKVYTFGQSLIRSWYKQDSVPCVDRHMLSIALGRKAEPKERSKLYAKDKSLAMLLEESLCIVAKWHSLRPQELQSLLWHDYRAKEGIEQ